MLVHIEAVRSAATPSSITNVVGLVGYFEVAPSAKILTWTYRMVSFSFSSSSLFLCGRRVKRLLIGQPSFLHLPCSLWPPFLSAFSNMKSNIDYLPASAIYMVPKKYKKYPLHNFWTMYINRSGINKHSKLKVRNAGPRFTTSTRQTFQK